MYNRYIPQADGSYQRSWMPDRPPEPPCPPPQRPPAPPCPPQGQPPQGKPPQPPKPPAGGPTGSFFRNLLPKDFSTEDLLVVLLLLLMTGECKEDQNTALLTLALYLFL